MLDMFLFLDGSNLDMKALQFVRGSCSGINRNLDVGLRCIDAVARRDHFCMLGRTCRSLG
jgi:hypothetical protein